MIAVLITLSMVLTASVMFPLDHRAGDLRDHGRVRGHRGRHRRVRAGGARRTARRSALAEAGAVLQPRSPQLAEAAPADKLSWRMPPLSELPTPVIRGARRIGLLGLRGYLALAMVMVIVKIVETALGH